MGKRTSTASDRARKVVSGTFTAAGQQSGAAAQGEAFFVGDFHASLIGAFTGSVTLERSFDGGTTWVAVATDGQGNPATYTAPVSVDLTEFEEDVLYRWNCTALSAGTPAYRISQ